MKLYTKPEKEYFLDYGETTFEKFCRFSFWALLVGTWIYFAIQIGF